MKENLDLALAFEDDLGGFELAAKGLTQKASKYFASCFISIADEKGGD